MARVINDVMTEDSLYLKSVTLSDITFFTMAGQKWRAMSDRCKENGSQQKKNNNYVGCAMSENFKNFQYFASWCQEQIGYLEGFELDKDLLVKGNKLYSEDNCVFLPKEINNLLLKANKVRGEHPIGVVYRKDTGLFRYQICLGCRRVKSQGYKSPQEAFVAYKDFKEDFIKQQANKWRDQIDPRAYEALMNYQVEITD